MDAKSADQNETNNTTWYFGPQEQKQMNNALPLMCHGVVSSHFRYKKQYLSRVLNRFKIYGTKVTQMFYF